MKVGIIGSGNVGITTAFAVAEKGSGHVVLWGRTPGKAQGKALDLAEASPIRRYDVRIEGTDQFERLMDVSVLVVAAGAARTAGMSRFDLLPQNLPLIEQLADRIAREHRDAGGPLAPLVVMMTEPVDVMTLAFQRRAAWPRERVLGVGGGLAAARMRHFISRELAISPADIDAMVLGTHGEGAAILERYCRISGLPLSQFLSRQKIGEVFDRTLTAGTWIVEQAKVGSSFYTPGAAASELVHAISHDNNRVLLASVVLEGEYGVKGRAGTVPVSIGCSGVKRVFELALTDEERAAFRRSMELQEPHVARLGQK